MKTRGDKSGKSWKQKRNSRMRALCKESTAKSPPAEGFSVLSAGAASTMAPASVSLGAAGRYRGALIQWRTPLFFRRRAGCIRATLEVRFRGR